MRLIRLLSVVLLALGFGLSVASAQEDEGDTEIPYAGIYDDIPFSRAEDGAFVLGDPDAPVTIIEFADFLCPACQNYRPTVEQFIEEYVASGQAKLEFRFTPIINEQVSPLFAALNECAYEEGAFWPAHYLLYDIAASGSIEQTIVADFAVELDLDGEYLASCVTGASQFLTDFAFADEMGVSGTPAIRARVSDGEAGVIAIEGQVYSSGGLPFEILAQFVESENPEELVRPLNQLRNPFLLEDTSIADSDPCEAPCWRGITPGETTFDEAMAIIEDDEQLSNLQTQEQGAARIAVWGQVDGDNCCELLAIDGETIDLMRLLTTPDVMVGAALEEQGEPAYVTINEVSTSQAFFTLIYPEKSVMIFVFVAGAESGELTADSEIIGVQYLSQDGMEQFLMASQLYEWDGYATFQDYASRDFAVLSDTE